jgi:hypothetical protein
MPTTWNDVVTAVLKTKPEGTSLKEVLPEASAEWKRIKKGQQPTKMMASLTMPGKKDFTTKKTSKVFHRKGHYEKTAADGTRRLPFRGIKKNKGKGKGRGSRKGRSAKSVSKLPTSESIIIVEESPMAGGQAAGEQSQDEIEQGDEALVSSPAQDQEQDQQTDANIDLIQETTGVEGDAVKQPPGMAGGRKRRSARRHSRKGKGKTKRHSRKGKRHSARRH